MTLNITFDFNCIISVEKKEDTFIDIQKLISLHNDFKVNIQIPGISASERLINGNHLDNFSKFKKRIYQLSERNFKILCPFAIWDITYWDNCIFPDEDMITLDKKIQEILFPKIPTCLPSGNPQNEIRKWKNARCDVVSMWCHIHYSGDIFVTSDQHFLKDKVKIDLSKIGSNNVFSPYETIRYLQNL